MQDIVFLIIETPNGKHRLRQRAKDVLGKPMEIDHGLYDTHALALEAMDRIIKPKTSYFNKDGEPLHDVPSTETNR